MGNKSLDIVMYWRGKGAVIMMTYYLLRVDPVLCKMLWRVSPLAVSFRCLTCPTMFQGAADQFAMLKQLVPNGCNNERQYPKPNNLCILESARLRVYTWNELCYKSRPNLVVGREGSTHTSLNQSVGKEINNVKHGYENCNLKRGRTSSHQPITEL